MAKKGIKKPPPKMPALMIMIGVPKKGGDRMPKGKGGKGKK